MVHEARALDAFEAALEIYPHLPGAETHIRELRDLTIGVIGYATGVTALGIAAVTCGLIAAFLNGAFGLCLGCELYLLIRRIRPARQAS